MSDDLVSRLRARNEYEAAGEIERLRSRVESLCISFDGKSEYIRILEADTLRLRTITPAMIKRAKKAYWDAADNMPYVDSDACVVAALKAALQGGGDE